MVRELLGVMRRPRFAVVTVGEGLSMLGDAAFEVGLAWAVIQTTGSVTALAGVLLFRAVPRSVLLLLGGAIVDRFSPRLVMLICHVVSAIVMVFAAVASANEQPRLWHLYVVALVMGVSSAFFIPASESIIPVLVGDDQLDRANALKGLLEQISFVVGPILGGLLAAGPGPWAAFTANAVTFVVAAATVLAAPASSRPSGVPSARVVLHEIGEGLGYARHSYEIRLVLMVVGAATLSYSGVFAVGLPALADSLNGGAAALGLMVAGWGAGQLIGVVAASLTGLPRRWDWLIIGMSLLEAGMFAFLGVAPSAWTAAIILCLVGIGVSYSSDVALPTFIQTKTPKQLLGRISSLIGLPRVVFEPLSISLLSVALAHSIRWGFAIASLPVLIIGIVLALDPRARNLSTRPDSQARPISEGILSTS
jgi:MFS family permease